MDAVRLGVAGLGRAFMLMLPTLLRHGRVRLVAAADPRAEARDRFAREFAAASYPTVAALCADPDVQAVYVASPHQLHLEHVRLAAAHGKHVLVEKPMALSPGDCEAMAGAARAAGVWLLVGHSHSYDLPYLRTRQLIEGGAFGAVRMINAINFTDFMYRPRRPEELDTAQGGGVVFSQAAHQVDVVRLLAGSRVTSVLARCGTWDPARRAEGAYQAHLGFEDGASASLSYSGYGRFDTDALHGWTGELGQARDGVGYGEARSRLRGVAGPEEEAELKDRRAYGSGDAAAAVLGAPPPPAHNHFGLVIVSCERGDLRPMPGSVEVYGEDARWSEPLAPPSVPRAEVIDELAAAVLDGRPPLHDGAWGMATMQVCLAILESSRAGREIMLHPPSGPAA